MPEESKLEMTQWCNEHDLPMRTIRTADDRIVCWFVWWVDAMDQSLPLEDALADALDPTVPRIKPCIPSFRVVLDQGVMVVDKVYGNKPPAI